MRVLTELRAKHSKAGDRAGLYSGINGNTGKIADMQTEDIWDPISVKL